ncbi:MAG: hypothetical protein OFPI_38830 [Osedax symbiont Rs2]|nr:MAG: hypothetical protein OFPI_38830 [Osedax symbiont Rs2]
MAKILQQAIANWDGKSVDEICDIYNRYLNQLGFSANLVLFIGQPATEKGASWLLKQHLQNQGKVPANEVYKRLSQLQQWQSKLHILQCIPSLPIAADDRANVHVFLRSCLIERNKFVRAWAYNGFYQLARQYEEYRDETEQFLRMAMRDEAPSVQARVRNILKQGF